MTFEEVAANVLFFKERYGIEEVCLSGGEPTVHRSFLSHLRFIRSQGLKTYLHTNAQRLAREEFIEEASPLVDRTLVGFSFHDSTSCEFLTGSALSFDLRKAGIRKLLDHSVPLRTNTVIMRANYQFLPEISRVIESMGVRSALFTFPFFFERTEDQVKKFSPPAFREVKPALRAAFDFLKGCGVEVFLQGLPPCRLDEFEHFREVDPDRAFVDSSCQFEEHSFLFSGMLGYARDSSCNDCAYEGECWGHPLPGAMGALDEDCQEQGQ